MLGAPDSIGGVYSYSSQNHKSTQLIKRTYNLPCNFNWELMGYDNEITFMAPPFDNIVYSYDKKGALRQQIPLKSIHFLHNPIQKMFPPNICPISFGQII